MIFTSVTQNCVLCGTCLFFHDETICVVYEFSIQEESYQIAIHTSFFLIAVSNLHMR